jgi:hypothetical protein
MWSHADLLLLPRYWIFHESTLSRLISHWSISHALLCSFFASSLALFMLSCALSMLLLCFLDASSSSVVVGLGSDTFFQPDPTRRTRIKIQSRVRVRELAQGSGSDGPACPDPTRNPKTAAQPVGWAPNSGFGDTTSSGWAFERTKTRIRPTRSAKSACPIQSVGLRHCAQPCPNLGLDARARVQLNPTITLSSLCFIFNNLKQWPTKSRYVTLFELLKINFHFRFLLFDDWRKVNIKCLTIKINDFDIFFDNSFSVFKVFFSWVSWLSIFVYDNLLAIFVLWFL